MRGLLKAGGLLAPALAGAVSLEEGESPSNRLANEESFIAKRVVDTIPSALITLHLPESTDTATTEDVVFRFDIRDSTDACGYGNVSINGQNLPEGGNGSFTVDEDRVIDTTWNLTCVTWNDVPQEQLLSMNIGSVDGRPVDDVGFTVRFQQIAPVWISDVEGTASMTRIHSIKQPESPCDDGEALDVDAELAELGYLRGQVAELQDMIFAKERRIAETLGWAHHHGPPMIEDCDSLRCVMKALFHKVKGAAWPFYGGEDFPPSGARHHGKPPRSWGKHPHGGAHAHEHLSFGQGHHGNHTNNGTHSHPPHFGHPPPFCKCPPSGPPPPHSSPHSPPHGPPHGPPRGPPRGPHRGPPPPPFDRDGPMPPPPGPPGAFPHIPPPPSGSFPKSSHHGHGPKPGHLEPEAPFPPPSGIHAPRPHGPGSKHHQEEKHAHPEVEISEVEAPEMDESEFPENSLEAELRRDFEHPEGPRHDRHDGPYHGSPYHHDSPQPFDFDPSMPPPPPPFDHDGPMPPPPGPPPFDGDGPPPPPPSPPGPHGPHGPHRGPPGMVFIHIVSVVASIILLGVFISVLHQRYVRRSPAFTHRRRRSYSNAPWYKKIFFGPNYQQLEEEEKEAMLRDCDSDCSSVQGDDDVITRDISTFRTAAEVVGEMVAVEEGRMMTQTHSRSRQSSHASMQMQMQQQQTYASVMPVSMPLQMNSVPIIISAEAAAMFPDLHQDDLVMDEALPAYQEANSSDDDDASELASSLMADGYRPGCSGSYTPSESGSQGASDILGDTKN